MPSRPPVALFILRHDEPGPASVLIIAMEPGGDYGVVTDLRRPGSALLCQRLHSRIVIIPEPQKMG